MSSRTHGDSTADARGYVEADWHSYCSLQTLANHWDRPGWTDERRSYHWLIALGNHGGVRALAHRCQQLLRELPTLDLVPLSSLHITLQRVGFTDEVSPGQLRDVLAAARLTLAGTPAIRVAVGPLAGSSGAVRFSVGPHAPIDAIRDSLLAAIATAFRPVGESDRFVPHLGIAYNNANTDARPIIDTVAKLRELGATEAWVSAVSLVELRRESRSYRWNLVDEIELGDGGDR